MVPDGEPTLDINLGKLIDKLHALNIPVAVISNASLINRSDVQQELIKADWVSLKIDAINTKFAKYFINIDNAQMYGVEFGLTIKATTYLLFAGGLQYSFAQNLNRDGPFKMPYWVRLENNFIVKLFYAITSDFEKEMHIFILFNKTKFIETGMKNESN